MPRPHALRGCEQASSPCSLQVNPKSHYSCVNRDSGFCWPEQAYKPDPVLPRGSGGHLSRTSVARRLQRPTRGRGGPPRRPPIWPCSGWGLPSQPGHPGCWWSLTPPFHPYPWEPRAVCFLWHCPSSHPAWALPSTLPCGVRTFLCVQRSPGGLTPQCYLQPEPAHCGRCASAGRTPAAPSHPIRRPSVPGASPPDDSSCPAEDDPDRCQKKHLRGGGRAAPET
jgi:hypothetical protein